MFINLRSTLRYLICCTAKSLVAAGLARRCLVQLSYAIGVAEPLSIYVDTYGTGKKTNEELVDVIRKNWDLRPGVMGKSSLFGEGQMIDAF